MAAFQYNMTVEDGSPLITYAPAGSWIDTPTNDPFASSYSGASYHATNAQGATATIVFNGTGLSIFGGHRSNYGTFSIAVDGQTISSGSSQADTASGNQLLGSASGLAYGAHTAVLTNTGGAPIDIDWISFESQIGGSDGGTGTMSIETIDNTDPSIVYLPTSAWGTNTNADFLNGTLSFTQTPGATAALTFTGGAIAVYGTVSPDHANIVVTIDGQVQIMAGGANGLSDQVHPKTLLYYQTGLSMDTPHTFTLAGDSQAAGPFVDLDMINIFTVAAPSDSTAPSSVTPFTNGNIATSIATPSSIPSGTSIAVETSSIPLSTSEASSTGAVSSSRLSTGAIVGAALGGLFLLLFLLSIIAFLVLRKRRNHHSKIEKSMISVSPILPLQKGPKTPILPMQTTPRDLENGEMRHAFPFPIPQKAAVDPRHSIAPSYYSTPTVYSRDSEESSSPLSPDVPMINVPQPRSNISRKPAPGASSGLDFYDTPARPSTRPPPMDFAQMDNSRRY